MLRHVDLALRFDVSAPRQARRFVAETLAGWGTPRRTEDVVLLASELVTNAILHGLPPASLRLTCGAEELTVEVSDAGPRQPALGRLDRPGDESGRGIALLDHLADRWGVRSLERGGKAVWFTVPLVE
jgi:anti-sigma regulatory factor (Ser/Thr protein kinase)